MAGLRGQALAAPELIDLEVASVWRRQVMAGQLEARRADLAVADLLALPLQRIPHRHLLTRCWELRQNLTTYDAAYVALAELLDVVLVTGDMTDVLVRDVPEDVIPARDSRASRLGLSRSEYLRRRRAQEAVSSRRPPLASMPVEYQTPAIEDRATGSVIPGDGHVSIQVNSQPAAAGSAASRETWVHRSRLTGTCRLRRGWH